MNFPLISVQTIYILGITNIIFLVLVLFSCRCFLGFKLYVKLVKTAWFKKVYKYHCWYWWGFIISVSLHTLIAYLLFKFPF